MFRIRQLTIERIIIFLFSILPVVDSLNGILLTKGLPSIGMLYKLFVLGVLVVFMLRQGSAPGTVILCCLGVVMYLTASVFINVYAFSGKLINTDYPVKLVFNVLTLALLYNCFRQDLIDGKSIYQHLVNDRYDPSALCP